nr:MAG TPA: hypothetical protein [Caudoviricetes sp.]
MTVTAWTALPIRDANRAVLMLSSRSRGSVFSVIVGLLS